MKKLILLFVIAMTVSLSACDDASIASKNISKEADKLEINRRIVFYNGINGEYLMSIEGKCSITKDQTDNQLEVLCRSGASSYKKHFLGISDNVTYFAEQIDSASVSAYHYKVVFKPLSIIPDVEVR
jgi:hypothetical protein